MKMRGIAAGGKSTAEAPVTRLPDAPTPGQRLLVEARGVAHTQRFSIRFDAWYRPVSWATGVPPASAYVDVDEQAVLVRMGWAFRASFPRSAITALKGSELAPPGWGVHGFGGRWLVNGSRAGIVVFELAARQKARVLGLRVPLQRLMVSVEDPDGLKAALQSGAAYR